MKKKLAKFISFLLAFISFALNASSMDEDEKNVAKSQFIYTFGMVHGMLQGIEKAFNPPTSLSELEGNDDIFLKMKETLEIMHGIGDSAALFSHAPELVSDVKSTDPRVKSSDSRIIAESAVRVGMKVRPQHFSSLEDEGITPDAGISIFYNFFREFVQDGALDVWLSCLNSSIEEKDSDNDSEAACQEFANSIGMLLKQIAMKKSLFDKYVDPNELQEIRDLSEWLKNNEGHSEYPDKYFRLFDLKLSIQIARSRALDEGCEYNFNLLKRMRPELAVLEEMSDIIPHEQKRWEEEERAEFENYILKEYEELDLFEPNRLRSFSKKIEGHQYGKLYYKIVCESFEIDSPLHQFVQQIWAVSQLDTIHQKPKEGRSRMPTESIDGTYAPNFGYEMQNSEAYQIWMTNPFARTSGDIVIDAYHSMVDFGISLDIPVFLERFEKYLAPYNDQEKPRHPYDEFMPAFERYLLERVFHKPFIGSYDCRLKNQLEKAAGSTEELLDCAFSALKELRKFSSDVFALKPSEDIILTEAIGSPFVFGIGFYGELFDNPNSFNYPQNRIWLTFSKSERNEGGYLLLTFMRYIAEYPYSRYLTSSIHQDLSQSFEKYKPFIQYQIRQKIEKGHRYEGFASQLEQHIPFDQLDAKLQSWIKDPLNWYHIPEGVDIDFPDELEPAEHHVQYSARGLLFDAVVGRSFSTQYPPELMNHLFSHWKDELLEKMDEGKAASIHAIEKLEDVEDKHIQNEIFDLLDRLVSEVNPELKALWELEINKKFKNFAPERIKQIESEINRINKKVGRLNERNVKLKASLKDVSLKIAETEDELRDVEEEKRVAELKMQELTTFTVQQLSREEYNRFRDYFFLNRDVSQCVEPLFSKVSCQDRFFPVFISHKPADYPLLDQAGSRFQLGNKMPYDVIAPCGDKCQCHALGHLYVGDMLCHQSMDHLDHIRQIHGLEGVKDQFVRLGCLNAK